MTGRLVSSRTINEGPIQHRCLLDPCFPCLSVAIHTMIRVHPCLSVAIHTASVFFRVYPWPSTRHPCFSVFIRGRPHDDPCFSVFIRGRPPGIRVHPCLSVAVHP